MGPLGLLSPHPGVSYLFTGTNAAPSHEGDGSLWGIANANLGTASGLYAGALGSPPPSWTSNLGDGIRQIDSKLKVSILSYANFRCSQFDTENHRHSSERAGRDCTSRYQRRADLAGPHATEYSSSGRLTRPV